MADKLDFKLDFNDLRNYIPQHLRNSVSASLLDNLFNRFMTKDESVPLYGYIGATDPDSKIPRIVADNPEREINAVTPVITFTLGTERFTYTFQDLLNRASLLGIDTKTLTWLFSQGNNFLPPIDLDKFANFYNYYWIGKAVGDAAPSWNFEREPEYYVIARPQPDDLDKTNVVTATVGSTTPLTGTGFIDQVYTVQFSSLLDFTITPSQPLSGPGGTYFPITSSFSLSPEPTGPFPLEITDTFTYTVERPGGVNPTDLLRFTVTRTLKDPLDPSQGYTEPSVGDQFIITPTYFSSNYTVNFVGSPGVKPSVTGVQTLRDYQSINGVQLFEGARVLVTQAAHASYPSGTTGGIFIVSEGTWSRAPDFDGSTEVAGAHVFDRNTQQLFESVGTPGAWGFSVIGTQNNTNDWQEGNYWVRRDQLLSLGLSTANVEQARRPIIEYASDLQLNSFVSGGLPSDSGVAFTQIKTEFNQLPLFDLFRYDGTHSGLVSSIFYYVEDPTAELDLLLQRRVKRSSNDGTDFLFNHGCADDDGALLFFKKGGDIKTVWHAGYNAVPALGDIPVVFSGTGAGSLTLTSVNPMTQQQIWTVTATSPTTFSVVGSKHRILPAPHDEAVVGSAYDNGEIAFTISGVFDIGDTFRIAVGGLELPRYVFLQNNVLSDLLGGKGADVNGVGAWLAPRTLINNPYNDTRSELAEGSVQTHFKGILNNQLPGADVDHAFGGSIKLWSEQQTLFFSLLMQRDMSPLSIIDVAKRLYSRGLNGMRDLYVKKVVQYFADEQVVAVDGSTLQTQRLVELLDYLLEIRATELDSRTVLQDTTAGVVGFPATLPQLGLQPLVAPTIIFDPVLGIDMLLHHDGHQSELQEDTMEFRQEVIGSYLSLQIKRSDGTSTPAVGSFDGTAPANPYKGELWVDSTQDWVIRAFDVAYDSTPPSGVPAGQLWWNRNSQLLYESDGTGWVPSSANPWVEVNLANNLNALMLQVELRLWAKINAQQRQYDFSVVENDPEFVAALQREFFTWAAGEGLQPLGSDYDSSDAFTWNYSQLNPAQAAPISSATVPPRWHRFLEAHQATVPGVLPTSRPNVEPWKLFGFADESSWMTGWVAPQLRDAPYNIHVRPADQTGYAPFVRAGQIDFTFNSGGTVKAVDVVSGVGANPPAPLAGQVVVDGIALTSGDRLLVVNDVLANCGVWQIGPAPAYTWFRPSPLSTSIPQRTVVSVTDGVSYAGTSWVSTKTANVGALEDVVFAQVREWLPAVWSDLQALQPALRLSINPFNDDLLPPYVNISRAWSSYALTNSIPPGVTATYAFGDGGPVEAVWERSIEYVYARAKSLFRYSPLELLGFAWGFNWVEVDGILYDGYNVEMPGHQRFKLHGESVLNVDRNMSTALSASGPPFTVTLTYDAYTDLREQCFSVRYAGERAAFAYAYEGMTQAIVDVSDPGFLLTVLIEDEGRPFRIGDAFTVTWDGTSVTTTFTPATYHQILGLGQIFTNALRDLSLASTANFATAAFRGWDVQMGHRIGALAATDDLKISTSRYTLSPASYSLVLKKSEAAKSTWIQALRLAIQSVGTFQQVNGSAPIPTGNGTDWVFRIEGYNPRHIELTYYTLDTSAGAPYEVFSVLDSAVTDTVWRRYTSVTGVTTATLPVVITGLQNVLNFLFGYVAYLYDQGWRHSDEHANNVDATTGRVRDWQLEIERAIEAVYRGLQGDQGFGMNPFIDRVWIKQPRGLLAQFSPSSLFDPDFHAAVYDVLGERMPTSDLRVLRGNPESSFGAAAPMYSAHAQLDEYEHLVLFSRYVQPSTQSGILYDPFSGSRVVSYRFNGRRQPNTTLRPEFGGYYISAGRVRQNLQASTDSLATAYDANRVFENTTMSRHALALLGFTPKDYFDDLDITRKTQFNFWRGLTQYKGTNLSIDAYLNNDRFKDARLDEFWAYKIAEYGDARQRQFPELRLNVTDCLQQFTQLQFDSDPSAAPSSPRFPITNFVQVSRLDEARWFSIDDLNLDTRFKAEQVGSLSRSVSGGELIVLPFVADVLVNSGSAVYQTVNQTTLLVTGPGQLTVSGFGAATSRYSPVKLINYVDREVIEDIPVWHPAAGQHTPRAIESVNVISAEDPARYNYSTLVVNNNNFDPLRPWGEREVGRTWFNTSTLEYVPYYDRTIFPSLPERLGRWGAQADYSRVEVYEWVRSDVPPAEYNAVASATAGNADIDPSVRASGEVALPYTYYRDRIWQRRAIAWSKTTTTSGGHPSFGNSSFNSKLFVVTPTVYALEVGTLAERGITAGMRIGMLEATTQDTNKPVPLSEAEVTGETTKVFSYGGGARTIDGLQQSSTGSIAGIVNITVTESTDVNGQLVFTTPSYASIPYSTVTDVDGDTIGFNYDITLTCTSVTSGEQQTVTLYTLFLPGTTASGAPTISVVPNQQYVAAFDLFGLQVSLTASTSYSGIVGNSVATSLVATLSNLVDVFDATIVVPVVPLPSSIEVLSNDPLDAEYDLGGWAAWMVPTQAQLDADAASPNQLWRPYYGPYNDPEVNPWSPTTEELDAAVAYVDDPLVLNTGVVIQRYAFDWTGWSVNENAFQRKTQVVTGPMYITQPATDTVSTGFIDLNANAPATINTAAGPVTPNTGDLVLLTNQLLAEENGIYQFLGTSFPLERVTEVDWVDERTTVYINGLAQLRSFYTIEDGVIRIPSVQAGSMVTVLTRPYPPTEAELAFDPDVEDDLTVQRHYKLDYEYVAVQQRDESGNLGDVTYYFWVRNKTTPANGKRLSVQTITQGIKNGPENFVTFQNIQQPPPPETPLPTDWFYDAMTISNLTSVVAKDDTFKLRFTRDFTLREDPREIDLKNVHTEWGLIRQNQRGRVPEQLWQKLVDSAAGKNAAGEDVPSLRRALYDERNGTQTQFGFSAEQTLAPSQLLRTTLAYAIVNTKVTEETLTAVVPDYIDFIEASIDLSSSDAIESPIERSLEKSRLVNQVEDQFFSTPELVRSTMTKIWAQAKISQVNELFFAALEDITASNFELTDIFKTSRLALYSVQEKQAAPAQPTYD